MVWHFVEDGIDLGRGRLGAVVHDSSVSVGEEAEP